MVSTYNTYSIYFSDLLSEEEANLKSIAQSNRSQLELTIQSHIKELNIPKPLNITSWNSNIDQKGTLLHLFPDIVIKATVHNSSINLIVGNLIEQNVCYE